MKKKLLKIVSTSTLAMIMCVGVLCGTIIPINSGGSAAATMTSQNPQSGQQAFHNASGAATQENLVAGGEALELNPQTDETIFTTESGFEIKSHTVAGQTLANSKVQYFTLGSYDGTPLNWIILATSTTMAENTTPAGKAINGDANNGKQTLSMMTTSNLSANQALVISEKVIPISTGVYSLSAHATKVVNGSSLYNDAVSLLDETSDYYSSYSSPSSNSTINSWCTGSSLGLSSYCGNKIVKNSNFNGNYYGFAMTNTQITTYISSSLRVAKDTSGTTRSYWCVDSITTNITKSVRTESVTITFPSQGIGPSYGASSQAATGSGTCTFSGSYVNTSGSIITISASIVGTLSVQASNFVSTSYTKPQCSYTASGTTSVTAYYRPAMVVDLSKF